MIDGTARGYYSHFRRVPDPVHLDGLGRPVVDAHADVVGLRPLPVLPAEGRVHVGLLAPRHGGIAVLVPQKRQRHAAPSKLPGHMLEVDGGLVRGLAAPLRVDNGPDRRIVHLLRERPGKAARSCRSDNVRDGRLRAAAREGDAFLAHPHRDQSEDFSVLDHSSFLSLDGHRRPFGTQVNSRKGSGGGKSLRLSATRGMSIGDARNHHRTSAQEANLGLFEYYCSMRLRGDHPDLYRTLPYKDPPHAHPNAYEGYKRDSNRQLRPLRRSIPVVFLCQAYHYDEEARKAGQVSVEIPVTAEYASLMAAMQNGLARELVSRGIMVECNLTSNYLIGTLRRYEKHPIFRFNGDGLVRSDGRRDNTMQLNVSVNTDDAGVFDASLENEYALLARCMEEQQEEGKPVYEVGSIYAYINNVREMGLSQVFRKGEPIW